MPQPKTILLAEDEPALGLIIKESLETRNFKVLLCDNGEKAYETYKLHQPELLVLDVMMPKMDGFTLTKTIRQIDQNIPILFLTAKSQTADVVEGFTLGGNDYLKKPFSMEELIVRIHNLLQRTEGQKTSEVIRLGDYTFNFAKQSLQFKNESPELLTHR